MSDSEESFFGDHIKPQRNQMDIKSQQVKISQDPKSNVVDKICEDENVQPDHLKVESKGISSFNQEFANMTGDASMNYEYSSGRPAAGYSELHTSRINDPIANSRRHYKAADDGIDVGMNKAGASSPGLQQKESTPDRNPVNVHQSHHDGQEGISCTNSGYAKMKGDPAMSYEYSVGRAAAGYPSPQISQNTEISEDENKGSEHQLEPEAIWYTNSQYAVMKGDPEMTYEYSSDRAAAGYPSPRIAHNTEPGSTSRPHSGMSGDEINTEMEKSGTSTPQPGSQECMQGTAKLDVVPSDQSEPERISYTNSEYSDMKNDSSMSYEYSSGRAAAGRPSNIFPHVTERGTGLHRHYKTADESPVSSPEPKRKRFGQDPVTRNISPSHHRKPEGSSYTNSEYSDMKNDSSMSYEYSSGRASAGHPSQVFPNATEGAPASRRHYKTAGDTFERVPDNGSPNMSRGQQSKPEGISYSNSEYANMKGDSSMRYKYSIGWPAAGCRTPKQ